MFYSINGVLLVFWFLWVLAGNVWYIASKRHIQFNDSNSTFTYCDKSTYDATFWAILECDIAFSVAFVVSISWAIYVYVLRKRYIY